MTRRLATLLGIVAVGTLLGATPALADGITNNDAIISQLNPTGTGIPLCFGPNGIPGGGVSALGNWNANAGAVMLQQVAQLHGSQHDVYNIASQGNVITDGTHYCLQG
ncbi:hypothetical protein D5S17_17095 [Pseudonocardiaceae bacterium YIM PH 21723]|nr:hypothetical protein D5S17_17095 [Pseudonocardiaceae bacterium YIM PH 21723]